MMSLDNKSNSVFCSNNLRADVQLHQQLVAASFGGAVSAIVSMYLLLLLPIFPFVVALFLYCIFSFFFLPSPPVYNPK